jgi:hypothetical protein
VTLIATLAISFCAAFSILVYNGVQVSLHAEKTLHAFHLTLEVLGDHVQTKGGRWPTSWDELTLIHHESEGGLRWPDDIEEIRARVKVNFYLTAAQVSAMDYEHFTAVEQVGPNYGSNDPFVRKLLYIMRSVNAGSQGQERIPRGPGG